MMTDTETETETERGTERAIPTTRTGRGGERRTGNGPVIGMIGTGEAAGTLQFNNALVTWTARGLRIKKKL